MVWWNREGGGSSPLDRFSSVMRSAQVLTVTGPTSGKPKCEFGIPTTPLEVVVYEVV